MRHPRFQHPPLRPPLSLILVLGKDHGVGVVSVDIDKVTLVRPKESRGDLKLDRIFCCVKLVIALSPHSFDDQHLHSLLLLRKTALIPCVSAD